MTLPLLAYTNVLLSCLTLKGQIFDFQHCLKIMRLLDILLQDLHSCSLLGGLAVFLLFYLTFFLTKSYKNSKKEPPGPRTLPLLGNLLQLDLKKPHHTLMEVRSFIEQIFVFSSVVHKVTKSILLLVVKKIWISLHGVFWTQKSCGPGRIQDSEGGTCFLWWRVWRERCDTNFGWS